MSPRPRTVTDEAIIAAAATVIGRLGPGKLTLAGVGKEIGLSAATLVQRFGSKRGLLLAMAKSAADSVDDCFEMLSIAVTTRVAGAPVHAQVVAAGTTLRRFMMAKRMRQMQKPLAGRVALVAGATRGAGRGIARALGEAGAIVYCTGRSVRGNQSPYKRPETIDETTEMINAAGGTAIPVRVDHTVEAEVEALFARVQREHGRLDVVVDSVAGEDPINSAYGWFWDADLTNAAKGLENALVSHFITAKHAAKAMMPARRGLIVEVTEGDAMSAGGHPVKQAAKLGLKQMALTMAAELYPHGVAAVAITPGFLRSESMLDGFGVTEQNWRDGGKTDKNFLASESPLFIGRAVAALAADPKIMQRTGQLFSSWALAREYGFTDADGTRPDWGSTKMDFSMFPPELLSYFRIGSRLSLEWLDTVTKTTRSFMKQLPKEARPEKKASVARKR